jgi:hypothetical protein
VCFDSDFRQRQDGTVNPMLCAVQCDKVSLDKIRFDNKPIHRDEGRTATTKKTKARKTRQD